MQTKAVDADQRSSGAMRSPGADARTELVERFFSGTGPTYDRMVHWATLGIDRLWKRRIVAMIPADTGPVLDLACGTGISTLAIASRFPGRRVIGVELRDEYLAIARAKTGSPSIEWVCSRAEDYQSAERFDCICSSYLAKYADLPRLVERGRSLLKPGGMFIAHDFTLPPDGPLLALWRAYFVLMRASVAKAVPSWKPIYEGLPRLIAETTWPADLSEALHSCGFEEVRRDDLTLYGSAIVSARCGD